MAPPARKLDALEQRFYLEYILDFNGERAALRAGYEPEKAKRTATSLLKKPEAQGLIDQYLRERRADMAVTEKAILNTIMRGALRDPIDFLTPEGTFKAPDELTPEARAAVESFSVHTIGKGKDATIEYRYKLVDKLKCLDLAGSYLSLWKENVNHTFDLTTLTDEQINEQLRELGSTLGLGHVIDGEATEITGAQDYVDVPGGGASPS